jgi:peptide-methionine (S)-S-oxide reductase
VPRETATLAGGCFWCLEATFEMLRGVDKSVSGYTGGQVANPSYKAVCTGRTGHAEAVQLTYDPAVIAFSDLLDVFFTIHDPTTLNRQGGDVGTQYRSAIFYHTPQQKAEAEAKIRELEARQVWGARFTTQVAALSDFYRAEVYHQGYYRNNPYEGYCQAVVAPKVVKMRKQWAHRLKAGA